MINDIKHPIGSKRHPIRITNPVDRTHFAYGTHVVVEESGYVSHFISSAKRIIVKQGGLIQKGTLATGHLDIKDGGYAEDLTCMQGVLITIEPGGVVRNLVASGKVNLHVYPGASITFKEKP